MKFVLSMIISLCFIVQGSFSPIHCILPPSVGSAYKVLGTCIGTADVCLLNMTCAQGFVGTPALTCIQNNSLFVPSGCAGVKILIYFR